MKEMGRIKRNHIFDEVISFECVCYGSHYSSLVENPDKIYQNIYLILYLVFSGDNSRNNKLNLIYISFFRDTFIMNLQQLLLHNALNYIEYILNVLF